ncbi:hypothetical protein BDV19DRAFT_11154 [Aspergillus venezuelensis]
MVSNTDDLRSEVLQNTLQQISSLNSDEATECCVICLGSLDEQCEAKPCKHRNFDYICLMTWLQEHPTCPLCKTEVCEVRYDLGNGEGQGRIHSVLKPETTNRAEEVRSGGSDLHSERAVRRHANVPEDEDDHEEEAIQRRRFVYQHNLYSLRMGSNRRQPAGSRYREQSPELFATEPEMVSKARTWLCRELRVFDFLHDHTQTSEPPEAHHTASIHARARQKPSRADFLHEYIIVILKTVDLQGSTGQAEAMIEEFLGRKNTRLSLHELRARLRSPCRSLSAWIDAVQYSTSNALPRREVSQDTAADITTDTDTGHGQATQRSPYRTATSLVAAPRGGHLHHGDPIVDGPGVGAEPRIPSA